MALLWSRETYRWIPCLDSGSLAVVSYWTRALALYLVRHVDAAGVIQVQRGLTLGEGIALRAGATQADRRWLVNAGYELLIDDGPCVRRPDSSIVLRDFASWQKTHDPRRRIYLRELGAWATLPLRTRALATDLVRRANDLGVVAEGGRDDLARLLARQGAVSRNLDDVRPHLEILHRDGFLCETNGGVAIRNYVAAQAPRSRPVSVPVQPPLPRAQTEDPLRTHCGPTEDPLRTHCGPTEDPPAQVPVNTNFTMPVSISLSSVSPPTAGHSDGRPPSVASVPASQPVAVPPVSSAKRPSVSAQGAFGFLLAEPPPSPVPAVPPAPAEQPAPAKPRRASAPRVRPDTPLPPGSMEARLAALIVEDDVLGPLTVRPNDLAARLVAACPRLGAGTGEELFARTRKALAHAAGRRKPVKNPRAFLWNWLTGDEEFERTKPGAVGVQALPRTRGPQLPVSADDSDGDGDVQTSNPFHKAAG